MSRVIYEGRIAGSFYGFNSDEIFTIANGTHWVQAKYKYWYHYAYRPPVVITQEGSTYMLTVSDHSIPVRRISVIESRIDGEFKGWDGESTYTLTNGQVWQQSPYKYQYKYAYRPEVLIYPAGGGHKMKVADTEAEVRGVR